VAKGYVVAFTGPSNSGKTTLIEKVARRLIVEHRVAIVKHDPKDKAVFDTEGKDSWKFSQTGADVVVVSPTRTTYFSPRTRTIEEIAAMTVPFDYLLVEGLKTLPLPRIAVFRGEVDESYLPHSEALAVDDTVDLDVVSLPATLDVLDLNDVDMVVDWIKKNAKAILS